METRRTGRIVEWNAAKGYGYARAKSGTHFLHIREFSDRNKPPAAGDVVTYVPGFDQKGRPCAKDAIQITTRGRISFGNVCALLALLVLPAVAWCCLPSDLYWLGALVLAINVVTYLTYADDKDRARSHKWRIPEATLHGLELLGGWAGAFVAQKRLRHKCSKGRYQAVFWFIVLVHQWLAFDFPLDWHFTRQLSTWLLS